MKAIILCLVLLPLMGPCNSAKILRCKCVKTENRVNKALITHTEVRAPTYYCNKEEVIVTLRNGNLKCLNPNSPFTIDLKNRENEKNSLRSKSNLASTTASTVISATGVSRASVNTLPVFVTRL